MFRYRVRPESTEYEFSAALRLRLTNAGRQLSNFQFLHARNERRYQVRLARHDAHLPVLTAQQSSVVEELTQSHVAVRPAGFDNAARQSAARAVEWLEADPSTEAVTYLPLAELAGNTALFTWGLSDHNLDIAENYIGLPVRYLGLEIKVERAAATTTFNSARNWHIDIEDRRMVKIIVYLNDVDELTGPFEFISAADTDALRRMLRWQPGLTFLTDPELREALPEIRGHRVTGGDGTAVFVDTSRLVHRVSRPQTRNRYSATFVYTSDRPFHTVARFMPSRDIVRPVLPTLSPRQRKALVGADS